MKLSERMRELKDEDCPWTLTIGLVLIWADEVAKLEAEHSLLRKFWDGLTERLFDGYSIDGFTIAELGTECDLLTEEIYEPEGKHKGMNMGESEPGELCYVNNLAKEQTNA